MQHTLATDLSEYGCIITTVGIVDTTDTPGNTVINDIARKHEAEMPVERTRPVRTGGDRVGRGH